MKDVHTRMIDLALDEAKKAAALGEVPVGAVIYRGETVLATAHNEVEVRKDPTAHAELLALQAALAKTGQMYLDGCTLAVTLEPCAMCAQALSWARVEEVRFGAYDVKSGGVVSGARVLNHAHHKPQVIGGQQEEACRHLLQDFFRQRR
jgi:tRNA(Arg) A34 adenosine deaminase TadA